MYTDATIEHARQHREEWMKGLYQALINDPSIKTEEVNALIQHFARCLEASVPQAEELAEN